MKKAALFVIPGIFYALLIVHRLLPAEPPVGSLMICGGGHPPPSIRAEFCRLAGGPQARIVVIPTATSNADRPEFLDELRRDWGGCGEVSILHTRDRTRADDPTFIRPLAEATGVWLS